MSLARFALRICALKALSDATLVGDNVRDSDITAIDVASDGSLRTDEDRPFIVIYTDDGTVEQADTRDLRQNGAVDFVCEFGIATAMTAIDEETGENTIIGVDVPATDAAFEMTLDLIDRQIDAALTGPSPWAAMWRKLHDRVLRIERRRAASAEDGARVAARQLRIRVDARPDPVPGQPLAATSVWHEFVAALGAKADPLAGVAVAFLGTQDPAVTTETIRPSRGHHAAEAAALGYGHLHEGGEDFTIASPAVETDD